MVRSIHCSLQEWYLGHGWCTLSSVSENSPKPRSNKHTRAVRVYTHLAHKLTIQTHILNYSSHKISSLTNIKLIFRGNVFNLPAVNGFCSICAWWSLPKAESYFFPDLRQGCQMIRDAQFFFIEDNNSMISGVNGIRSCNQWCQWYQTRTLSSMVSNFVSSIPSMVLVVPSSEWSTRARLNLTSWSTASLPTSASPTKSTRSGLLTRISWMSMCVCVCVCVCRVGKSRNKHWKGWRERERSSALCPPYLGQWPHEWFIVLHPSCSVYQYNIIALLLSWNKNLTCTGDCRTSIILCYWALSIGQWNPWNGAM